MDLTRLQKDFKCGSGRHRMTEVTRLMGKTDVQAEIRSWNILRV